MRSIAVLALCVGLAACAHRAPQHFEPPPLSTDEEKDAAGTLWRECLLAQEPKYDDMISDAHTVASTLAADCGEQFANYMSVLVRGELPRISQPILASAPQARYDMALRVVLVQRAKRQGLPPPAR